MRQETRQALTPGHDTAADTALTSPAGELERSDRGKGNGKATRPVPADPSGW